MHVVNSKVFILKQESVHGQSLQGGMTSPGIDPFSPEAVETPEQTTPEKRARELVAQLSGEIESGATQEQVHDAYDRISENLGFERPLFRHDEGCQAPLVSCNCGLDTFLLTHFPSV